VYDQDDETSDDPIGSGTINLRDLPTDGSEVSFDLAEETDASYTIYAKLVATS
jgi:hypothetical protein